METRCYVVYKFDELSEESKKKAIEKNRNINVDFDFWYEYTIGTWKEALDQIGFENAEIFFRLAYCQGDGAVFVTKTIDIPKLIEFLSRKWEPKTSIDPILGTDKEEFRNWITNKIGCEDYKKKYRKLLVAYNSADNASMQIQFNRLSSFYSHEYTAETWGEFGMYSKNFPALERLWDDFIETVEHIRVKICRAIYKDLDQEYTYQISDEAVIETLIANDYDFTVSGRID